MDNKQLINSSIDYKTQSTPTREQIKTSVDSDDNELGGLLKQNTDDLASGIISSFISQIFDEDGLKKVDRDQLEEFIEVFGFGSYDELKNYKLDDIISVVTGEKDIEDIKKQNKPSTEIKFKDFNEYDTNKQEKKQKSFLGITIPIF